MKKKLLAIIAIVCVAAFALSACGGGSGSGGGGNSGGGAAETYDVGAFTVSLPSGWTAFPQDDIFGDKDAAGNYPVDPETILLAKGAKDEFDAYSCPSVRIYWYSPNAYVLDSKSFYDNVEDISGVTVKGTECEAYTGESMGYTYQFIHYQTETEQYDFNILISVDGKKTGITWEDPEVKTIIESVSVKTESETESK